jgi:RNA polymerase sigma-70 factor (ECF subfamily)
MRILNDPDDAEEVMQTTFIKACEKFGTFEERSGLGTWLYRIATNEALMLRRQRQASSVSLAETGEDMPSEDMPQSVSDWASDPASLALSTELHAQLERALMDLPESLRLVFVLRDLQGLSTDETAKALHIGASAVKVRLHRARKQLRELLADYINCCRNAA